MPITARNVLVAGISFIALLLLPAGALASPVAPGFGSGPTSITNSTTADFSLSGLESGAQVICSLDGGEYTAETCNSEDPSQVHLIDLPDGAHTLSVVQYSDPSDQSLSDSYYWTVDTVGPSDVDITYPTEGGHTAQDFMLGASFDSGSRIECRLDAAPETANADGWGACPGIGNGTIFKAGWNTQLHWGENPASDQYRVVGFGSMTQESCQGMFDSDRNVCWITPTGNSADTSMSSMLGSFGVTDCASFTGSGPPSPYVAFGSWNGSNGFGVGSWNQFQLDCADTTAAITAHLTNLSVGSHKLDIRSLDAAGNAGSISWVDWTVDGASPGDTQTDSSGNVFVNAGVLEFGAKSNGSFGTVGTTPSGFHERTETNPVTGQTNGLGFVAPADPVTRDWSNELGDFFTPGSPYEGWTITANGNVSGGNDDGGMSGHWDSVSASDHSATWHSDSPFEGLDITQTYSVPGNDQLINGTVTLTNNSGADVADVAYSRGVDPDNCVIDRQSFNPSGIDEYQTANTIWSQYGLDAAAISVVTAEASCHNDTQISLSSTDPGSRVAVARNEWARMTNPFAILNSDGTDFAVNPGEAIDSDNDMNVAIPADPIHDNVIHDGETVTLHFTYSLSKPALKTLGVPDLAPPHITDKPARYSNSTAASFTFTGADGAGFACKIDDGTWTNCDSPVTMDGLSEGDHTFRVDQSTGAGINSGVSVYTWTVDTTAPSAPTITEAPSGRTADTGATLSFTGEDGATFECELNGGDWASCTPPYSLSDLSGDVTFAVRQTDRAGNTSYAQAAGWHVGLAAPAAPRITGAPYLPTQAGYLDLVISAERDTTAECSLDGAAFATCGTLVSDPTSWNRTVSLTGLAVGEHSLAARVTNADGTSDVTTVTWKVGVATQALVFPTAPTVKAIKPKSGHWTISLAVDASGDTRPAAQPMTVQIWTQAKKPSPTMAPPKRPTAANKVVRYAPSIRWNGAAKPRWLRVGNKAGRWSSWQQIING